jgi:hypothetical protein
VVSSAFRFVFLFLQFVLITSWEYLGRYSEVLVYYFGRVRLAYWRFINVRWFWLYCLYLTSDGIKFGPFQRLFALKFNRLF